MATERAVSRWAGAVYLVVVVTGTFCLGYVPGRINVPGQPMETLANIAAHPALFQAGIAAHMVEQVAFLALPLVLFGLLQRVHRGAAVAMVALAVVSVPISLVAVTHQLDALSVLTEPRFNQALPATQVQGLALLSLRGYDHALFMARLFWGLWLLPFGYLVLKSRALPRVLGGLLMLGGVGYAVDVFGELLVPGYTHTRVSDYATLPASIGEIGICLWLLVVGMRRADSAAL